MTDENLDDASDRITAAIGEAIKAGELGDDTAGMPNQWVLCATYYDSSGELCTAFLTNNGARTHETSDYWRWARWRGRRTHGGGCTMTATTEQGRQAPTKEQ